MMLVANMTRADLEVAILEQDGLMGIDEARFYGHKWTDDELRAVVQAWIERGDECAAAGGRR